MDALVFNGKKITFENEKIKDIKALKDYYNAELDSEIDKKFIKTIATATVINQKQGKLGKQYDKKSPEEISIIVEKGVNNSKVRYKTGNGDMGQVDAVSYIVDKNTARIKTAIDVFSTNTGAAAGSKVGSVIGSIFGPAGAALGGALGGVVGGIGGKAIGKVINKGVDMVASEVKSAVRAVSGAVSSFCSSVASFFGL